jgi:hypothetical protein
MDPIVILDGPEDTPSCLSATRPVTAHVELSAPRPWLQRGARPLTLRAVYEHLELSGQICRHLKRDLVVGLEEERAVVGRSLALRAPPSRHTDGGTRLASGSEMAPCAAVRHGEAAKQRAPWSQSCWLPG